MLIRPASEVRHPCVGRSAATNSTGAATVPRKCPRRHPRRFDEYGNVRFNYAKARLDNLSFSYKTSPRRVDISSPMQTGAGVKTRDVCAPAGPEIIGQRARHRSFTHPTLDGGYQDALTIELWIVPSGATRPNRARA